MIHKACMPVYMNSGKIVAGRVDGWRIEGSTRGPRGPKKGIFWGKKILFDISFLKRIQNDGGSVPPYSANFVWKTNPLKGGRR